MSSFSSIPNNSPLDALTRPVINPRKPLPKYTDPLRGAATGPLSLPTKPTNNGTEPAEARAQRAAEGLVSTTFIEPILKQMRESNTAPPPFGPGQGEKQFSSLLDTKLADGIVHAANFPLVKRIAEEMLRNMPTQRPATPQQTLDIKG